MRGFLTDDFDKTARQLLLNPIKQVASAALIVLPGAAAFPVSGDRVS